MAAVAAAAAAAAAAAVQASVVNQVALIQLLQQQQTALQCQLEEQSSSKHEPGKLAKGTHNYHPWAL